MRTDIALKTVLIYFVMLESLRPVEIAVTVATVEPLDGAVRQ